jgi:hypothetical protein
MLGCAVAAAVLAGLVDRWPSSAAVLLPTALACCAAAAAFVFDEHATGVVAVTPRGAGWRRTTRLAAVAVPLVVWGVIVLVRPGGVPLERSGWWVVGGATIALTGGLAAGASRREVAAPSAALAATVTLAVISPVVVTAFLGWDSVYPVSGFGQGSWTFWSLVAAGGAAAWVVAMRPGIRA